MRNIALAALLLFGFSTVRAIEQENTVGPQMGLVGQKVKSRANGRGAGIYSEGGGRYEESVRQGNVYTLQAKSVTVVATSDIAPLPANGSPIIGVHNPVGNSKVFVLLKAGCSTVSGTPGGPLYLDAIPANDGISITTSAVITNNLTNRTGGTNAVGFSGSSTGGDGMTGSVLATTIRPLGGPAAIAAGAGVYSTDEDVNGANYIQPGGFMGVSAHAVGTSHVLSCYMMWEEVNL